MDISKNEVSACGFISFSALIITIVLFVAAVGSSTDIFRYLFVCVSGIWLTNIARIKVGCLTFFFPFDMKDVFIYKCL